MFFSLLFASRGWKNKTSESRKNKKILGVENRISFFIAALYVHGADIEASEREREEKGYRTGHLQKLMNVKVPLHIFLPFAEVEQKSRNLFKINLYFIQTTICICSPLLHIVFIIRL